MDFWVFSLKDNDLQLFEGALFSSLKIYRSLEKPQFTSGHTTERLHYSISLDLGSLKPLSFMLVPLKFPNGVRFCTLNILYQKEIYLDK